MNTPADFITDSGDNGAKLTGRRSVATTQVQAAPSGVNRTTVSPVEMKALKTSNVGVGADVQANLTIINNFVSTYGDSEGISSVNSILNGKQLLNGKTLTDEQQAMIAAALVKIIKADGLAISSLNSPQQRALFIGRALQMVLNNDSDNNQWITNQCGATSVHIGFAKSAPQDVVDMLVGLTVDGEYAVKDFATGRARIVNGKPQVVKLAANTEERIKAESTEEGRAEITRRMMADAGLSGNAVVSGNGRDAPNIILQSAMLGSQTGNTYNAMTDDSAHQVLGGRRLTGASSGEIMGMAETMSRGREHVILYKTKENNVTDEKIITAIEYNANRGNPVVVGMWGIGMGAHNDHAFLVTKVENGRVYLQNPWGKDFLINPAYSHLITLEPGSEGKDQAIYSMSVKDFNEHLNFAVVRAQYNAHNEVVNRWGGTRDDWERHKANGVIAARRESGHSAPVEGTDEFVEMFNNEVAKHFTTPPLSVEHDDKRIGIKAAGDTQELEEEERLAREEAKRREAKSTNDGSETSSEESDRRVNVADSSKLVLFSRVINSRYLPKGLQKFLGLDISSSDDKQV